MWVVGVSDVGGGGLQSVGGVSLACGAALRGPVGWLGSEGGCETESVSLR